MGSRPRNLVRDLRYLLLGNLTQLVLCLLQPLRGRVYDVFIRTAAQVRKPGHDQLADLVGDVAVESPRPADTPKQTFGLALVHLPQRRLHQPVVGVNQGGAELAPMRLVPGRFEQIQDTRDYALRLAHTKTLQVLHQPEECLGILAIAGQHVLEQRLPRLRVFGDQLLLDDSPGTTVPSDREDSRVQLVPIVRPCADQRSKETPSLREGRELRVCLQHAGRFHLRQFVGVNLLT